MKWNGIAVDTQRCYYVRKKVHRMKKQDIPYYAYIFNFPKIEIKSVNDQLNKITCETTECALELFKLDYLNECKFIKSSVIELMDIIHSCETLLYYLCEKYGYEVLEFRQAVIDKNDGRGYYGQH